MPWSAIRRRNGGFGHLTNRKGRPVGAGANGSVTPLPFRSISVRSLVISLFVSFGEFEKHDFLALVVDIVQHPIRADSQPILSGEL